MKSEKDREFEEINNAVNSGCGCLVIIGLFAMITLLGYAIFN